MKMRRSILLLAALILVSPLFAGGTREEAAAVGADLKEAPMLHALVEAGTLEALDERLPVNPAIEPAPELGVYGGDLRTFWNGMGDKWRPGFTTVEPLFRFSPTGDTIEPNVASGYDVNADSTEYIIYLREGMKWSDGVPFTADDVLFYWEHMLLKESFGKKLYNCYYSLNPATGEKFQAEVTKVDDYTVKVTHAYPHPLFLEKLLIDNKWFFAPAHYYRTILPEFIGEEAALALAQEKGFNDVKAMGKWTGYYYWIWPERPTLRPWVAQNNPNDEVVVWERNPYYWKTDVEGRQLPYMDRIVFERIEEANTILLKSMAGELDMIPTQDMANYPLLMQNKDSGNYRVIEWKTNDVDVIQYNQTVEDEGLRELFRNPDFRAALSQAIDRDEINQIVFDGWCTPMQAALLPGQAYASTTWPQKWAAYEPDKASRLLDKAGLGWDAKHEFRTRPDGSDLTLIVHYMTGSSEQMMDKPLELVKKYWEDLGIRTILKGVDRTFYEEMKYSNQLQVAGTSSDFTVFNLPLRSDVMVPIRNFMVWSSAWGKYMESDGASGVAPEGDVVKVLENYTMMAASENKADIDRYAKEIVALHEKNVWMTGLIGEKPYFWVVNNRVHNFPEGLYMNDELRYLNIGKPYLFFIEE